MINPDELVVTHDEDGQQFTVWVDGHLALLAYHRAPGLISLDHTAVPPAIEGNGVAAKLTSTALDFARGQNLRVVPRCSYAAAYIRQHAEYQDLLARDTR
jgi:predicted GNAT family acetyltransferase